MFFPTVEWGGYLEAIQLCENYPPWENLIQHDSIFKILKEIEDCFAGNIIGQKPVIKSDAELFRKLVDAVTEVDANKLNSKVLDILKKSTKSEFLSKYPKETFEAYKILVIFFFDHYTDYTCLEKFAVLGNIDVVDFILKNSKVTFTRKHMEDITVKIIKNGTPEMVNYLLENTVFSAKGLSRMVLAAANQESIPVLELLVKKGATLTKEEISYIYDYKSILPVFIFLMENFTEMRKNIASFMRHFIGNDKPDFIKYLVEKQGAEIPLNLVIKDNAALTLSYLVENNKIIEKLTEEHLIKAAEFRAFKCLKILWNVIPDREQTIRYLVNEQRSQNTQFLNNLMVNKMLEKDHIITMFNNAVQTKNYTYINYFITFYLKKGIDENLIHEFFLKIIK